MELGNLNEKAGILSRKIADAKNEIAKEVIGQHEMIEKIIIGTVTGGHILLEGVPGLAKSRTVSAVANVIGAEFKRIQFTPDLLPADLIGTEIYNHNSGEFVTKKGPLFSNIILADEINRAPAKVQSALLEAMQEKQVTIGGKTYKLEEPFLVLATQNPIEQEGTYPLPEAQQDRFMMKLKVSYSTREEEKKIIELVTGEHGLISEVSSKLSREEINEIREYVKKIYVDERVKNYVLDLVFKTREPSQYIACGASPRAGINMVLAAKGKALMEGRGYVTPDDVKYVAKDVLRHRILLTYEAEAEEISSDMIIEEMLKNIIIP